MLPSCISLPFPIDHHEHRRRLWWESSNCKHSIVLRLSVASAGFLPRGEVAADRWRFPRRRELFVFGFRRSLAGALGGPMHRWINAVHGALRPDVIAVASVMGAPSMEAAAVAVDVSVSLVGAELPPSCLHL